MVGSPLAKFKFPKKTAIGVLLQFEVEIPIFIRSVNLHQTVQKERVKKTRFIEYNAKFLKMLVFLQKNYFFFHCVNKSEDFRAKICAASLGFLKTLLSIFGISSRTPGKICGMTAPILSVCEYFFGKTFTSAP